MSCVSECVYNVHVCLSVCMMSCVSECVYDVMCV